jgi:integrase
MCYVLSVYLGADRGQPDAAGGLAKLPKTLTKTLPTGSVAALLATLNADSRPQRSSDWMERDRALILTALLAALRADELLRANVGDLRRSDDGAVIHVRGKGGKDRRIPIEPSMVEVLKRHLDSRAARFPTTAKERSPGRGWAA